MCGGATRVHAPAKIDRFLLIRAYAECLLCRRLTQDPLRNHLNPKGDNEKVPYACGKTSVLLRHILKSVFLRWDENWRTVRSTILRRAITSAGVYGVS